MRRGWEMAQCSAGANRAQSENHGDADLDSNLTRKARPGAFLSWPSEQCCSLPDWLVDRNMQSRGDAGTTAHISNLFQCICSVRSLADRARVLEVHVPLRNSRITHTNHPFVNRVVHCPLKCPSLTHTYIGSYCVSPPCLLSPNFRLFQLQPLQNRKSMEEASTHSLQASPTSAHRHRCEAHGQSSLLPSSRLTASQIPLSATTLGWVVLYVGSCQPNHPRYCSNLNNLDAYAVAPSITQTVASSLNAVLPHHSSSGWVRTLSFFLQLHRVNPVPSEARIPSIRSHRAHNLR